MSQKEGTKKSYHSERAIENVSDLMILKESNTENAICDEYERQSLEKDESKIQECSVDKQESTGS